MKKPAVSDSASSLIDEKIAALGDWRAEVLAKIRDVVRKTDPEVVEEWKWGIPVWSCGGIICTGETYKAAVKMTFPKGAALADPSGLFNSSLEGNVRRAIDVREGEKLNVAALKALFREAIALNLASKPKPKEPAKKMSRGSAAKSKKVPAKPKATAKTKAASPKSPKPKVKPTSKKTS